MYVVLLLTARCPHSSTFELLADADQRIGECRSGELLMPSCALRRLLHRNGFPAPNASKATGAILATLASPLSSPRPAAFHNALDGRLWRVSVRQKLRQSSQSHNDGPCALALHAYQISSAYRPASTMPATIMKSQTCVLLSVDVGVPATHPIPMTCGPASYTRLASPQAPFAKTPKSAPAMTRRTARSGVSFQNPRWHSCPVLPTH